MNYSKELKDALLRRMLPPNNESITKISKEEGISEQTLRNWRDKARRDGCAAPGTDALPDDWSTQDKFLVVVETASMNETELAEYARKKGLYVEQIKSWKDACLNANGGVAKEAARLNRELKDSEKECKKLEKELQRKEKALAELNAYKLKEQATKIASEKGLDISLLTFFNFETVKAEEINSKIEEVSNAFNKAVEKAVNERLKEDTPIEKSGFDNTKNKSIARASY